MEEKFLNKYMSNFVQIYAKNINIKTKKITLKIKINPKF